MMRGRLRDLTRGMDGSQIISVSVNSDFRETFDELRDTDVSIEITKYRQARSLEANAYCWALLGQIAAKKQNEEPDAGWTPEKAYRKAIKDTGGVYTVMGVRADAVEFFSENWSRGHIGRWVEILDGSSKEGWYNVKVYYGSSDYDTEQMSRLISSVIQDAEALGIPTITEKEAQRMIGNWKKGEKKREPVSGNLPR